MKFNKACFLVLITLLFLPSIFAITSQEKQAVDTFLENKTNKDIIYEIYQQYKQDSDNFTQSISPITLSNLRDGTIFVFDGTSSSDTSESRVYGTYNSFQDKITIYLKTIYNDSLHSNFTQQDILYKIENTLLHELGHKISRETPGEVTYDSFNITRGVDFPESFNRQYFVDLTNLGSNLIDIPEVLRQTIDMDFYYFPDISPYDTDEHASETFVRFSAICIQEDVNYTNWFNLYEVSNRTICGNFEIHPQLLSRYNAESQEFIINYVYEYEPGLLKYNEESSEMAEVVEGIYDVIGITLNNFVNLLTGSLFNLIILSLIIGSLMFIGVLMLQNIKNATNSSMRNNRRK